MHTVEVPFADTAAADLTFSLTQGRLPSVHSTVAHLTAGSGRALRVELAVLGCSHQVIVSGGGTAFIETLACLPSSAPALPDSRLTAGIAGAGVHDFRSRVEHVAADRFLTAVDDIVRATRGAEHHAVVSFPGHPGAVTALALGPSAATGTEAGAGAEAGADGTQRVGDALSWQTWHCYPQHGEIVHTRTTLTGLEHAFRPTAGAHPCPARPSEVSI
ncbi:DUF2617 family protein [Nocardia zapadnayensis]|uniref:DUF2617 family protein n=1 Tax=Brevibacterium sp. R8603A2 TaxID=2929779 RepID=UPI001FF84E62|nr:MULTISPECIES: DUF2617 family protein [Actinomycetes]MCK1802880.1 DUF2617 family protein [Brevibacterium sp. R8603A2]MCX0277788.1 DUF2617 family protein [Nocardia zapadnayensis]